MLGDTFNHDDQFWQVPDHDGAHYHWVLQQAHNLLRPRNYLEIGTQNGGTLRLASCASIAVDPAFAIEGDVLGAKPSCSFYQIESDAFFLEYRVIELFGGPAEMVFLDGLHWFEYLLRDFMNVEKFCKTNSVIFVHDCLPTDAFLARRLNDDFRYREISTHPDWWAGDVWKTIAILKKERPDLDIYALNAPPTGLVAITNLNPRSTLLQEKYYDCIRSMRSKTLFGYGIDKYYQDLEVLNTNIFDSKATLSTRFWL